MPNRTTIATVAGVAVFAAAAVAFGATPGPDVRLSNDVAGGYVSAFALATGTPYTDATITECGRARGRQNEPSAVIDPRDTRVVVGSANDYCGTYNDGVDADGAPLPVGPIWLGYYRSETSGASFTSSLVPGYPGDSSPYARLSQLRTASAGDPVLAWDSHGRLFAGSETSDDPAGSPKTLGDVAVATFENPGGEGGSTLDDGKAFRRNVIVDRGSSAPNLLGQFNDKTAIEVDRTGGPCDGNVYFSYARFDGSGGNSIQFARSTDHGVRFSAPKKLSAGTHAVQFPDIAVTGNGHVYVTFRRIASRRQTDAVVYARSTDCGATFSPTRVATTFVPYDAQDVPAPEPAPSQAFVDDPLFEEEGDAPGGVARDCGDFDAACESGYTFFRRDTQVRSTADQKDAVHEWVHVVYDPTIPGTEVDTGTTYGSIAPGRGSQSGVYYLRIDGADGSITAPARIDPQATGHQLFPDIDADAGTLHALWWDSRDDTAYSPTRPVGNTAAGVTVPSLDVYASARPTGTGAWSPGVPLTDVRSNPNYEQFGGRTVPFAGDYLWISAVGTSTFGVWTDWRNTVAGPDPREGGDDDDDSADVQQCRTLTATGWSGDTCPRAGGLDQDIYGDMTP
jgi:hypothetical protein